ncbi:HpcH/HpaI aldolase/citrate lyase family protein [Sphingomonas sanguinis]|jgi:citrate lyase subunit beta/citryl-CoA lyase|uniref:CoA ester lyase n=1 Tax=Sphingomonas sanguinis TaxID=33051 RepID=A0A7Y7URM8_9SPHN|nr:CoA ester lyase [Sphingomonas sanguinis]MBZ6383181.1 CoA ester lyase [Sphingomonas sanguinis]NNG50042.1 CoA ester lyase [Sphingomonas sanguinis]NNG53621.1 CoA ester lyase [Sphingomonas sanguinis]NVP32477.1 CoA ester lyase [Sphingomonas sanguinis]
MRLRSLLFVPGDRPDRMAKALGLGADALILDLEDAVAPGAKPAARQAVAAFLAQPRDHGVQLFVRINPVDGPLAAEDLAAILPARPDGIVLPKAEGLVSLHALAARGVEHIPILPIVTETPTAIFRLGEYAGSSLPLAGLTWGAEDLPAAIGATTAREADGSYTAPYQLARSLTLFAAHAAGTAAIETVYPDFRDLDGLAAYAARGQRDGFTGMMAIHPAQVPVINAAFTPSEQDIARAQAIVDLFAANPGAGALQLDGKMVDAPHLKAAQALLARARG